MFCDSFFYNKTVIKSLIYLTISLWITMIDKNKNYIIADMFLIWLS